MDNVTRQLLAEGFKSMFSAKPKGIPLDGVALFPSHITSEFFILEKISKGQIVIVEVNFELLVFIPPPPQSWD